ncbi:MAG: hypothetical protein QOD81_2022 [Solirubrobacteraceae bacterium]|jgi:hypothetical protein|nr:hypothetical protein [Solirubrobacteraceae bacterium]
MTEQVVPSNRAAERTVRRCEPTGEPFSANHRAEVERLLAERWEPETAERARDNELRRRAFAPIERLVKEDPDATAAAVELRDYTTARLDRPVNFSGILHALGGGMKHTLGGPNLIPDLHAGINAFAHPYDFVALNDFGRPADVTVAADRLAGTFSFSLPWGREHARHAAAGVGLTLEAGVGGIAHIRPGWRYEYSYKAAGNWLSSHTEGAATAVVQDAVSGAVLKTARSPLWNVDNDHEGQDDSWIDSWGLNLDVFLQAGQKFTVTFLANGMVDDSGQGDWFGAFSFARANMSMDIPLVVVELGP